MIWTDKSDQIDWESISIEQVLTKEPDIANFKVRNFGTKTWRPALGDEIEIYDGLDKVFAGVVVELTEGVDGLAKFLQVNCKDHSYSLDRILVSKAYANQTIDQIVADLIGTFAPSFTYANTNAPFIIGKVIFNYLSVSQCFQKLTKISPDYEWYVDSEKDIHFFKPILEVAPFSLDDTSGNYIWGSLVLHDEAHQLKNEILVRGGEILSATSRTEIFNGDGSKKIFPLGSKFTNSDAGGVAVVPVVNVGGNPKTVGIDFKDPETDFDCFWNFAEKYIRFKVSTIPPSGTNNVDVSGIPLFPLVVQKSNQSSVLTWGLFQGLIVDKTIRDLTTAQDRADQELSLYSDPIGTGTFRTYKSGLKVGQWIKVQSTIRNRDKYYKIQAITLHPHTHDDFVYSIELTASEDLGINDILQKLLLKEPTDSIEIQSDEVIQRYTYFTDDFNIVDSFSVIDVDSPPYYWGLSSPHDFSWSFGTWN